eukprot:3623203-Ditylum_brightwellii.AAC.1
MWEPIWYYKKCKAPEDPLKKARWMGFVHDAGDDMTYYIKTEESPFKYVIRSVICTRRRHVRTEREHVNEDSFLQPELREIELDFLNNDDEVILDNMIGEAGEKGESEKRGVPGSGEMDQQEEEGKEECPKLINRGGNNEDSDEESENEEGRKMEEDEEEDSDEALPIEGKG